MYILTLRSCQSGRLVNYDPDANCLEASQSPCSQHSLDVLFFFLHDMHSMLVSTWRKPSLVLFAQGFDSPPCQSQPFARYASQMGPPIPLGYPAFIIGALEHYGLVAGDKSMCEMQRSRNHLVRHVVNLCHSYHRSKWHRIASIQQLTFSAIHCSYFTVLSFC